MSNCKQKISRGRITAMFILAGMSVCVQPARAVVKPQEIEPDYTKGETLAWRYENADNFNYSSLGSIGATGYLWWSRSPSSVNDTATATTRTIQVGSVMKGTPADGILKQKDVILGVQSPRVIPDKHLQVDEHCHRPGCKGVRGSCGHFA